MFVNTDKLTEDGCEVREKDKVCRSRGGESCAFDGAMIVLQPIADTAHIVHGPVACCGNSWEGRGSLSTKGDMHRMGFTTDMTELDIVYGSEEKLFNAIVQVCDEVKPKAVFVYATCVSGLIGEDIETVCRNAEEETRVRVIPVNAPGFVGPKNLGNRIAGEALLDHVIGTGEPPCPEYPAINLIGEYNIAGDLMNIEPLLAEAGIRVLSRISGNAVFEEVTYAHRATLNVVVCGRALINVAKEMERRYGIPYIEVSFFGSTETAKALRLIASNLKLRILNIEKLIERKEEKLAARLEPYRHLRGKKAVLYTGGVKSWSFISALMDLGIETVAVGTKKSTFEDEKKMKEILGEDAPLVENTAPANLRKLMKENNADILVAGGRNLFLAMKEGFPFVDVNQERHTAYAGYEGLVNFAEQISCSIRFFSRGDKTEKAPPVVRKERDISIDPLKHSQSIGAVIALQGIDRALAVIHGAQGCTFLAKVLVTKHFREPTALAGTKLFTEEVVMGSEEKAVSAIEGFIKKESPDIIGILSSGLSEVRGDDVSGAMKKIKGRNAGCRVINISTPDYEGGMETGYAKAVKAVLENLINGEAASREKSPAQINVLPGPHLTPADFTELREIIGSFGLTPLVLPDLSALDGSRQGFGPLSSGGTNAGSIEKMCASAFTLAIGTVMELPARFLMEKCGTDYMVMDSAAGLEGTDVLMNTLSAISGRPVPPGCVRQRKVLVDGMRDAHFYFNGKKICIALEPDHAVQTSKWLSEMGTEVALAVVPDDPGSANMIRAEKVIVGDLFSVKGCFDLLISNSHAADTAGRLGVPLYQTGFPVYKMLGHTAKVTIGYRGTLAMINDTANLLMKEVH